MLNKIALAIALLFACSSNSFAQVHFEKININTALQVNPVKAIVREPFTALATIELEIINKLDEPLKLIKVNSLNARKAGLYETFKSKLGAEQVKQVKKLTIKPASSFNFTDKS